MRDLIKDPNGRLIGSVETTSDGRQKAYNEIGQLLGSFDPNHETTKNDTGQLVAKGNAISGLLFGKRR